MLYYALVFFILAIIASAPGFFGIAGAMVDIARIFFFLFLVMFIITLVFGVVGRRGI